MTRKCVLLAVGLLACGGPKIPQQPRAKGVEVTVDTSGANPVISWTPYSSRATNLTVVASDCAYGARKTLIDQPTIRVTGGSEHITWWLLPGKDTKGEGFDGPVVFGSNVPGTSTNMPPVELQPKCHFTVQLAFPDQTVAESRPFMVKTATSIATADQQMKSAGLDKPWVSAKAGAKPVELPPPDADAQAKVAGRYELVTIGGKPLPFDYGNGCKMTAVWIEYAADGTFKTGYTMACTTGPFASDSKGKWGVAGDKIVMDDGAGPVQVTADGMTRNGPGGTFAYKKK